MHSVGSSDSSGGSRSARSPRQRFRPGTYALLIAGLLATLPNAGAQSAGGASQMFPDVVSVKVRASGGGRFDFDVTVSSPYDTPGRYADAFRVMSAEGTVLGERILWHDHANEQPFTRDLHGVTIPGRVHQVIVQARDSANGYGGRTMEVTLPGRQ